MSYKDIKISDYSYDLPDDRIAKYPLSRRDSSRLLHYVDGVISSHLFSDLPGLLPQDTLVVMNDTRVIRARLTFHRETGSRIEVFCLDPIVPALYEQALNATKQTIWHCMVGNSRRWKEQTLSKQLPNGGILTVEKVPGEASQVKFSWDTDATFGDILESVGELPIPPYLNRETEVSDLSTYQTVYAEHEGSVAAPTAGLHFTPDVLLDMKEKGIRTTKVTLHVGAGTFKPVKSETMGGHEMHSEVIHVTIDALKAITRQIEEGKTITAIGTTSTRTLESLYYMGVNVLKQQDNPYYVRQWSPYEIPHDDIGTLEALKALEAEGHDIVGATQLIIEPGFRYRLVDKLVTNFHQPHSTLLLLVAALVGDDWKEIYHYALDNGYRFLSYGDSSLLERQTCPK